MEIIIEKTWLIILTSLLGIIAYWAKSTKDDLKQDDHNLSIRIDTSYSALNQRLSIVEAATTENKIALAKIETTLSSIAKDIRELKENTILPSHRFGTFNNFMANGMPIIHDALAKAEKIIDNEGSHGR